MIATAPIDWQSWRSNYPRMGPMDQRCFYDEVFLVQPDQARYSADSVDALLCLIAKPDLRVIELGGWTGALAAEMLGRFAGVGSWENFEISSAAVSATVCDDDRYSAVLLDDWYWCRPHEADVFVASHVLEHLTFADVEKVIAMTEARWWYLQAPLDRGPSCWDGYRGSHILEVGWDAIENALRARGLEAIPSLSGDHVRCFRRVGT